MLEEKPIKMERVGKKSIDCEVLRLALIAELDAVNLYEQLAATTENETIREVLLDVAKEEKTHVGEFQTLLLRMDPEQVKELEHGKEEVEEELGLLDHQEHLHFSLYRTACVCRRNFPNNLNHRLKLSAGYES